jgi:cytoskeletal protein RodZ
MAEEIVACPGCAKKFRIPEGAASGTFPCTACGADVPYGAAARKPAARPAAAPAQRAPAPAPAPRPAAAAPRPAAAPARRAGAASSRRAAREEPSDEPKSSHAAIWWAIGVGGAALLTLVWWLTRPTSPSHAPTDTASQTSKPPAKPPEKPAEKPAAAQPADTAKPVPAATAPAATAPAPADTTKPEPSATEKPKTPDPAVVEKKPEPVTVKPKGDIALLGHEVASASGTTPEERSDMDRLVTLAMDWNAGKDGVAAASKLVKMGRKAIPPLLSAFGKQYTTGKWATETDQYGAYQLQQVLRDIVRSDGRPEFIAVFQPGGLAPAEDFEKAAKMWVDWWNVKGQFITKFRTSNE